MRQANTMRLTPKMSSNPNLAVLAVLADSRAGLLCRSLSRGFATIVILSYSLSSAAGPFASSMAAPIMSPGVATAPSSVAATAGPPAPGPVVPQLTSLQTRAGSAINTYGISAMAANNFRNLARIGLVVDSPNIQSINADPTSQLTRGTADPNHFTLASNTKIITAALVLEQTANIDESPFYTVIAAKRDPSDPSKATYVALVSNGDPEVSSKFYHDDDNIRFIPNEGGYTYDRNGHAISNSQHGYTLDRIAKAFTAAGIRSISGPIVLVPADPRLEHSVYPPNVDRADMSGSWGALASAFNYDGNSCLVGIYESNMVEWQDRVLDATTRKTAFSWLNFPVAVKITPGAPRSTYVKPVLLSDLSIQARDDQDLYLTRYDVVGTYGPSDRNRAGAVASDVLNIGNARSWYGNRLLTALQQQGVDISNAKLEQFNAALWSKQNQWALAAENRLATVTSSSTRELIHTMLQHSVGLYGDALAKALIVKRDLAKPESEKGNYLEYEVKVLMNAQINKWLDEAGHPDPLDLKKHVQLFDANGMSRSNKILPRVFLELLKLWKTKPYFRTLLSDLPVSGESGTLAGRFKEGARSIDGVSTSPYAARGKIHAKTGTFYEEVNLSGYIDHGGGDYIPFVFLINVATRPSNTETAKAMVGALRQEQDYAMAEIYRLLQRQPHSPLPPAGSYNGEAASTTANLR